VRFRNTPTLHHREAWKMKWNEGLTAGWRASGGCWPISREAYKDARFKKFGELEEDTYEAFLSAPVTARNRVVGVITCSTVCRTRKHTRGENGVLLTTDRANRWDAS